MRDRLDDLAKLTDALYQAELGKMQALTASEGKLRQSLAQLDEQHRNNQTLPHADLTGVRQIGADVLWQGWVSRSRLELNTQLAQVLVQKSRMIQSMRRAFGKQLAARSIADDARDKAINALEKRRLADEDDLRMLKSTRD